MCCCVFNEGPGCVKAKLFPFTVCKKTCFHRQKICQHLEEIWQQPKLILIHLAELAWQQGSILQLYTPLNYHLLIQKGHRGVHTK